MPSSRLFSPKDWPLASKLAGVLFVLALVPLVVVALVNARDVESQSIAREEAVLERRATAAARRLEERVARLRAYVEVLASNPALADAVIDPAPPELWSERHPAMEALLDSIRENNPWFQNVYLLDERGVCIATSEHDEKPEMIGRSYDYRPYFRQPRASGRPFVSDVLKNANSPGTAIFVSAPLVVQDRVAAVAVIKIDTAALHDVVADLARLGGRVWMVDRFGVVVSDATPEGTHEIGDPMSLQFHPLGDVSRFIAQFEETKRYGDPNAENYIGKVQAPLGLDALWRTLVGATPGAQEHEVPPAPGAAGRPTMLGYGPVWSDEEQPYGYVVIGEPSAQFREPLAAITRASVLRIVLAFVAVAFVIAVSLRGLSRRMAELTAATHRLAQGDRSVVLPTTPADELGVLAGSFNDLAQRLSQSHGTLEREREEADAAREIAEARASLDDAVLVRVGVRTRASGERLQEHVAALPDPGRGLATDACDDVLAQAETALAFSSRGLPQPGRESIEVTRLLREAIERARPNAALGNTTVELEIDNALGRITSDPRRLAWIVAELLDNAIRSTRRGTVTLHGVRHEAEERLIVSVRDSGVGMTRGQREQLRSPKPQPGGAGLGLHLAARLAASVGGDLAVDATPGDGTTVTLTLPIDGPSHRS